MFNKRPLLFLFTLFLFNFAFATKIVVRDKKPLPEEPTFVETASEVLLTCSLMEIEALQTTLSDGHAIIGISTEKEITTEIISNLETQTQISEYSIILTGTYKGRDYSCIDVNEPNRMKCTLCVEVVKLI